VGAGRSGTAAFYTPFVRFTNATRPGNFARDPSLTGYHQVVTNRRSNSTEFRVRYAETDRMGVVYHANYLVWCEVGRVEFMRALGRDYASLEHQGTGLAVTEARVRYLAPARFGDPIRVVTTLTDVRSRSVSVDYVISNAETGVRLATAHTALVSIDRDGRLMAIPPDFRATLEAAL
jgi:acyl-CoA thioester hydrolase